MIVREKLNKHNWKHTYYYYLPHSVHTAEPAPTSTRTTSSIRSTTSSSCAGSGRSVAVARASTLPTPVPTASGASGGAVHPKGQHRTRHFESTIINKRTPLLENQLRTIVEKCLDYSINPPKPLTGRGVGFAM